MPIINYKQKKFNLPSTTAYEDEANVFTQPQNIQGDFWPSMFSIYRLKSTTGDEVNMTHDLQQTNNTRVRAATYGAWWETNSLNHENARMFLSLRTDGDSDAYQFEWHEGGEFYAGSAGLENNSMFLDFATIDASTVTTTPKVFTLPNITTELTGLTATQTNTGAKTFNNNTMKFRNPGNTFSLTVANPAVTANVTDTMAFLNINNLYTKPQTIKTNDWINPAILNLHRPLSTTNDECNISFNLNNTSNAIKMATYMGAYWVANTLNHETASYFMSITGDGDEQLYQYEWDAAGHFFCDTVEANTVLAANLNVEGGSAIVESETDLIGADKAWFQSEFIKYNDVTGTQHVTLNNDSTQLVSNKVFDDTNDITDLIVQFPSKGKKNGIFNCLNTDLVSSASGILQGNLVASLPSGSTITKKIDPFGTWLKLETGTTVNNQVGHRSKTFTESDLNPRMKVRFRLVQSTNCTMFIGFGETDSAFLTGSDYLNAKHGFGLLFKSSVSSTNYRVYRNDGSGTGSLHSTSMPLVDTAAIHTVEIYSYNDGFNVRWVCIFDGTQIADLNSDQPSAEADLGIQVSLETLSGGSNKIMEYYYCETEMDE